MRRALIQSLVLHAFLLSVFFVQASHDAVTERPPLLKVDLVALPDQLKSDLPAINPSGLVKKAKEQERLEAQKQITAFRKEQLMEQVRAWTRESETEKKAAEAEETAKSAFLARGNTLSNGSSLLGTLQVGIEQQYVDAVRERLHQHFELPLYLERRKDLKAKVTLWIQENGGLEHFQFDQPSTEPLFNESIEQCIQKSVPFPAVPSAARSHVKKGLSFAFPL